MHFHIGWADLFLVLLRSSSLLGWSDDLLVDIIQYLHLAHNRYRVHRDLF